MGHIVFFIANDSVDQIVSRFADTLPDKTGIKKVRAGLDNAVLIARGLDIQEVDVIIARGNTAIALTKARLPFPVIPLMVGPDEIADAFEEALALTGKDRPLIGVSGFEQSIGNIKALLRLRGIEIRFYPIGSIEDIQTIAKHALQDKVDVMISGELCARVCRERGIPSVEMKTSLESIRLAYNQALEFQKTTMRNRALSEEESLFSRISPDVLVAIDQNGTIVSSNERAALFFNQALPVLRGGMLFSHPSFIHLALSDMRQLSESNTVAVIHQSHVPYALSVYQARISDGNDGYVVKIQSAAEIQNSENTLRKVLQAPSEEFSPTIRQLFLHGLFTRNTLEMIAPLQEKPTPILLSSESGCGAGWLARAIHQAGPRRDMPFVHENCEMLSLWPSAEFPDPNLTKSLRLAHNGTLFLENVDQLSSGTQLTLLAYLRNKQIPAMAQDNPLPVDARIIASCSLDIHKSVLSSSFMAELYWALSQGSVLLPPLREHPGDIVRAFCLYLSFLTGSNVSEMHLNASSAEVLANYRWPGNLIQLWYFTKSLADLDEEARLKAVTLKNSLRRFTFLEETDPSAERQSNPETRDPSSVIMKNKLITRDMLADLLKKNSGSKSRTADDLGISRTSLWKCLKVLNIES